MAEPGRIGKSYNQIETQYERVRNRILDDRANGKLTTAEMENRLMAVDEIGARYMNNSYRNAERNQDGTIRRDWYRRRTPQQVYMRRNNRR